MSCDPDSDELIFYVNGKKIVTKRADPEVSLLSYLRRECILYAVQLTGTKYGCGAGGCGACTVMERLAKAHGSQCGFCSPGMVMSMYSLLRNNPEPTIEDIMEYLSGNLCRCTGYRPILDGFRTFDKKCCSAERDEENMLPGMTTLKLFNRSDLLPLDPTQEIIFPPELMLMLNKPMKTSTYRGERVTWYSASTLPELLELTSKYPKAPLVVGNTNIGIQMKIQGIIPPVIISPLRILELYSNSTNDKGLVIGGAVTLSQLKQILQENISKSPPEKNKIFKALLQQLGTLAGEQIRSMASIGGHVISRAAISDLNPVLAAGGAMLNLVSKGGSRTIPMNEAFFTDPSALKPGEILLSVLIPYSGQNQFVSAFRQAQREENASAIVNAGMQVQFNDGTDVIKDIAIFYGGIGSTTMYAKNTSKALIGRNWNDAMLSEANSQILKEITIPPSASEGKVEYKRSLTCGFFFKFYAEVTQSMNKPVFPLFHNKNPFFGNYFFSNIIAFKVQ
ncbi:hypothetical protein GDO78_018882 [Eleutherodactylus coqui]|uniref:FAD-binding PCMH-type domain-containing protein n=1 Tax=Eleutherodactylus coqui TaxID=57060 RepID=A0A8J6E6L9_ELECQ|nr:hypothetical protein GDO78_018882 [Eleutherodactylus coqui]